MNALLTELTSLESKLNFLESSPATRKDLQENVGWYINRFYDQLPSMKAYEPLFDGHQADSNMAIGEDPQPIDHVLNTLHEFIEKPGINTTSGNFFGYIPGGGLYTAALGNYLSSVLNRYSSMVFTSPGGVAIEKHLIQWVSQLIGYPDTAFGNITSGGSLATTIAIQIARSAKNISLKDSHRYVIYLGAHTHFCFAKALHVLSLQVVHQRVVPLNDQHRIDVVVLNHMIEKDLEDGLIPWMIVASAGTTDTGAIDPLPAIHEIATKNNIWLHVDAAYGGFFMLTDEGKKLLHGLHYADSIIMDAHKTLFMPYGIAFVLTKKHKDLLKANQYFSTEKSNYLLQDAIPEHESFSAAFLSPELTRPFRGLQLWCSLQLLGVNFFRDALREKLLLTNYFHQSITSIQGVEATSPNLSIVAFRYVPKNFDADNFNKKLQKEILKDGTVFISTTQINQKYYLRFACVCFRSHLSNVHTAIRIISEKITLIKNGIEKDLKVELSMT